MANTPVKQGDISKKELMDAYSKLKTRTKRTNEIARKEGEAMMNNLITVGATGLSGWYLGGEMKKSIKAAASISDPKKKLAKLKASGKVSGVDIDLIVGGGALAAGMMKWGGKFSPTMSAIGTGVLGGYAFRRGYAAGIEVKNSNGANNASGNAGV